MLSRYALGSFASRMSALRGCSSPTQALKVAIRL
jgi:hypothetical protein